MSVRLTRGEYWLLTQAVRYKLPLSILSLPEGPPWDVNTIDMALNCQGHGMGFDQLVRTLHKLFERNWITLQPGHDKPEPRVWEAATIRAELSKHQAHHCSAYYGLTAEGGQAWEQFARPQWQQFIEHEYGDEIDASGMLGRDEDPQHWRSMHVITAQPGQLGQYMRAVRAEYEIAADSEQLDALGDWRPVYWKSPTHAVRCRFRCREKPLGDDEYWLRPTETFPVWCRWL
jgi:hypothetical protein